MVSKELLSEVLDTDIKHINKISIDTNSVCFSIPYGVRCIKIYELAHKCKEWAYNNGYEIRYTSRGSYYLALFNSRYPRKTKQLNETFQEMIKACEWILKELKCKKNLNK